jgi:thiol-disulfide isomerase/thioredoxin
MQRGSRLTSAFAVLLASLALGCGTTARNPESSLASSSEPIAAPLDPGRGSEAKSAAASADPGEPAAAQARAAPRKEGEELIGTRAHDWLGAQWIQGGPLTLEGLRGRVVLVRWWTAPDCPLCAGTAPSLNELHSRYNNQGLVVVGFYHHKSDAPLRPEDVARYKGKFGFEFPVAIDPDWKTLHAWWMSAAPRDYTSVSFLVDRKGVIRYIHPGGKYARGDQAYDEIKATIEKLLVEPPA